MKKLYFLPLMAILATNSFAALSETDMTQIKTTINSGLADVMGVAVAIFGVLAGIWGVRKIVKVLNRS